jgi:hypothetical protein
MAVAVLVALLEGLQAFTPERFRSSVAAPSCTTRQGDANANAAEPSYSTFSFWPRSVIRGADRAEGTPQVPAADRNPQPDGGAMEPQAQA